MANILDEVMALAASGSNVSRRAWLNVEYNSVDISEDISQYILSASVTDNMSGRADDITISLEDRAHLWRDPWFPELTAQLKVTICTYNWESLSDGYQYLYMGNFYVDEITVHDNPATVEIRGVSVPDDTPLRGNKHSRAWEKVDLKKVFTDVAGENKLELFWDTEINPKLDRVDQSDQSDLDLLNSLVKDVGLALKVSDKKLIVFDEYKYEQADPVLTITPPDYLVTGQEGTPCINVHLGGDFTAKTRDIFWKCHVKYQDTKTKKVIEATFADPNKEAGQILEINEQVADVAEAERLAKKRLREKNCDEFVGRYTRQGCLVLLAGMVVQVTGYGKCDGKYIITQATHELRPEYTTSINIRRCLNGY